MGNALYQKIIENYIQAYNRFDVDKMLIDMDENVHFENIANGQVTQETNGIAELKNQAEKAKGFFKERKQTITSFKFNGDVIEVNIDYKGVLAQDIPDGPNAGDKIELKGKSIFRFKNNKIIGLKDIS